MLHRAKIGQSLDHLGDGGTLLSYRTVDADQVSAPLVQNSVQDDRGLAQLAVADNQFALAAANGNHRVDGFNTSLNRFAHRLTIDDAGRQSFQRIALRRRNRPFVIDRISQGIHHPANHSIANRNRHNLVGALDRIAFADLGVVAQQHGADLIFFEVQCDAEDVMRKRDHLAGHTFVQAVNTRDAIADGNYGADLLHRHGLLVVLDLLAQNFRDFVRFNIRHSCSSFRFRYSASRRSRIRFNCSRTDPS